MGLLSSIGSFFFGTGSSSMPKKEPKPTERVGTGGFTIFGGFISNAEKNPDLEGTKRYTTYANAFLNLPIAAKGFRLYLDLGSGADWTVRPADDSKEAQRIANEVDLLRDAGYRPWRQLVRYQLRFSVMDHAIQAWAARRLPSGQWTLDVEPRPNHTVWRWEIDPATGALLGVWQLSPQTLQETFLPRSRLLYAVDSTFTDSPVGLGIARHIVEVSDRITKYRKLEGQGFESDLAGMPLARIPYSALTDQIGKTVGDRTFTAADRDNLVSTIKTFLEKHQANPSRGMWLDSEPYTNNDGTPSSVKKWDLETVQSDSADSQKAIGAAIEREEHRAAVMVDAEHLLLSGTQHAGGNKAISSDKSERVAENVNGRLKEIADVLNRDYLGPLGKLNGWPEALMPTLVPSDVTPLDVEAMSRVLMNMTGAMLEPDDDAIDFVREQAGIPPQPARLSTQAAIDASMMAQKPKQQQEPGGVPSEQQQNKRGR
jgi:hypothetical protein